MKIKNIKNKILPFSTQFLDEMKHLTSHHNAKQIFT